MDQARLQQEYAALGSVFDPQEQLIQQQMSQLPGQAQAQRSALEQAKVNAFRDITSQARGRGVYFSGFRPEEEARYTGATFLPALAEVEGRQLQQQTALQQALLGVRQERQKQATATLQDILNREQQERQFRIEQEARAREAAASRAASTPQLPTTQQFLTQAFSGYRPAYEGGTAYFTEREVIPALMANYGLNQRDAAKLAFEYRKRVFGEGYGRI